MEKVRETELKEKLYDCMISEGGLDALCTCIAAELGNPVSIHLPSRTIIGRSSDFSRDLLDDFVNAFSLDDQLDTTAVFNQIVDRLKLREPVIGTFPYYRHKQILYGCFSDGHLCAILDCVIVNRTDLESAAKIMEIAAKAVVPVLRQNQYLVKKESHHMQIYLNALLRGEKQELYQQLGLAGSAINNTASWLLAVAIVPEKESREEIFDQCEKLCARKEKIWCTKFDDNIVLLMDAGRKDRLHELEEVCQEDGTIVVSEAYSDLSRTAKMYKQCKEVYSIAGVTGYKDKTVFVSEYKSVLYFLYSYFESDRQDWKSTRLMNIRNYDLINDTEYYKTIRAYLLNEMNAVKMAEVLHVHKNTILYRLQRISEIFNLDLKDCRVITDLYLNLYVVGEGALVGEGA